MQEAGTGRQCWHGAAGEPSLMDMRRVCVCVCVLFLSLSLADKLVILAPLESLPLSPCNWQHNQPQQRAASCFRCGDYPSYSPPPLLPSSVRIPSTSRLQLSQLRLLTRCIRSPSHPCPFFIRHWGQRAVAASRSLASPDSNPVSPVGCGFTFVHTHSHTLTHSHSHIRRFTY